MTLAVTYAHDRSSREPRPMKAQQIWGVADQAVPSLERREVSLVRHE